MSTRVKEGQGGGAGLGDDPDGSSSLRPPSGPSGPPVESRLGPGEIVRRTKEKVRAFPRLDLALFFRRLTFHLS